LLLVAVDVWIDSVGKPEHLDLLDDPNPYTHVRHYRRLWDDILVMVRKSPAESNKSRGPIIRVVVLGISAVGGFILLMVFLGITFLPSATIAGVSSLFVRL